MNNRLIKTIAVAITTLCSFSVFANLSQGPDGGIVGYTCFNGGIATGTVFTTDWDSAMQAQYECEHNGGRFMLIY